MQKSLEKIEIKSKINNLRAQVGRELKKTKKTESGQSRDEVSGTTADMIALQDKDFDKNINQER